MENNCYVYYACSFSRAEPYVEQRAGSKLGKEDNKAVCGHLDYLTHAEGIMRKVRLDES